MLHIVHVNDTETLSVEGWARVATVVGRLRAEGRCDLLLHGGDVRIGAPHTLPLIGVLNAVGFDAYALGNHELDSGMGQLRPQVLALQAPMLCANVEGAPEFPPHRLFSRGGRRVAVIGVTLGDMVVLQPERNTPGMRFGPPDSALAALVPELRRQADYVVVLSHCGFEADKVLAAAVPGIDLIVGGHSHHRLDEPVLVGGTPIVQAGASGEYVGWVSIGNGERAAGGLIRTAGVAPDPATMAVAPKDEPSADELEVVGHWITDLRRPHYAAETPLGNLTADVMRACGGTDLALLRCAGVNNGFAPGPIRRCDLPHLVHIGEDRLARVALSGAELLEVLEAGARDAYYLLTLSGGRVAYDGTRPTGCRVTAAEVGGAPLEPQRTYTVTCTEVFARGAAGFTTLLSKPYETLPLTLGGALAQYIGQVRTLGPLEDGRLTILAPIPGRA